MKNRIINVGDTHFKFMDLGDFGEVILGPWEEIYADSEFCTIFKLGYLLQDDNGEPLAVLGIVKTTISAIAENHLKNMHANYKNFNEEEIKKYTKLDKDPLVCLILEGSLNLAIGKDYAHTSAYKISIEEGEKISQWATIRISRRNDIKNLEMCREKLLKAAELDDESIQRRRESLFKKNGLL